ncbi:MAG: homoserine kinase [Paracoccaceae bacterium]|nr:homoserine kinase [Paracoccaceae bacterium]MDG1737741.1 homoserine kinase [Paracoccaceae bacterium]MDG2257330.1 homoserine kinase [Paracoccaceae bacterium]
MSVVQDALPIWGLEGSKASLVAARENAVFRVERSQGPLALRVHRQGYRTDAELRSELDWMAELANAGLSVPVPLASVSGELLHRVKAHQVDVLSWLGGETLDTGLCKMDVQTRNATFNQFGLEIARLHEVSDSWIGAKTCDRPSWNLSGLIGEMPLWGRFWENPELTAKERTLLVEFRNFANNKLDALSAKLDYGLIHADLVPANVMVDGNAIRFIDFDDGGFGYRLFEIATALLKLQDEPDYHVLKTALLAGYKSLRDLDTEALDLFLALRAMTYVGWNISRQNEDEIGKRNARFIAKATELAGLVMDS